MVDGTDDETVDVLVETPKGSRAKFEWDPERHGLRLDRRLGSATVFPTDYGWIEGTRSSDGETLDALVLGEEPLFPGCWVRVRPIGVFWISYGRTGDDDPEKMSEAKILAVPDADPGWSEIRDVDDLSEHQRNQISHFFDVYKQLDPGRNPSPAGYEGREAALRVIADSREG